MDQEIPPPVEIPAAALDADVVRSVVEEFVLREGTDYGAFEVGLDAKIEQVLAQIRRGETKVYFDPATDSVTLGRYPLPFRGHES